MLRRLLVVFGIAASLSCAGSVFALGLGAGTSELSGTGGFTTVSYSGQSQTQVQIGALYGYCITKMFEIAPEIQVTSISSGGSSVTLFGGVANAIFNFASSGTAVPFIELGLGYSTLTGGGGGSDLHTAILPRLGGGVRILVGNSASVNIGATYEHLSTSVSGGGGSLGGNQFGVNVGLSIFPSGLK